MPHGSGAASLSPSLTLKAAFHGGFSLWYGMPLIRQQGWEYKLRLFLDSKSDSNFAWGTNDCCSMVCEWIRLSTGTDVYADFSGKYTTQIGAYRVIKTVTGGIDEENAAEYVTKQFDMPEVLVLMAQRGDVVLFDAPEGKRLGIVSLHPARAVFLTDTGLKYERTADCRRAWKV